MLDGVSAAASILAILQISTQVCILCQRYRKGVKNALKDIERLRDEVFALSDVLETFRTIFENQDAANLSIVRLLENAGGPVETCQRSLEELRKRLETVPGMKWKWPFSETDVNKIVSDLERQKSLLELALATDNLNTSISTKCDLSELRKAVNVAHEDASRTAMLQWLCCIDPSSNHNAAREKRDDQTGNWLFEDQKFHDWKSEQNSMLWLHGKAGCGKSILCSSDIQAYSSPNLSSTIIHQLLESIRDQTNCALAYFYCDFSDVEKQNVRSFLASTSQQLCRQRYDTPSALKERYERSLAGHYNPTTEDLFAIFQASLEGFDDAFVIVDAIDESPVANDNRATLLQYIQRIRDAGSQSLHLLMTSRRETDIEDGLAVKTAAPAPKLVDIQSEVVNRDIVRFVENQLDGPSFSKWTSPLKQLVKAQMAEKADGSFRYVALQLNALKLLKQPKQIKTALAALPKSLDETYDRMLSAIDGEYYYKVHSALQLLVCSERPLELEEFAEATAIDLREDPSFDVENRYLQPSDVLQLLSGLVAPVEAGSGWPGDTWTEVKFSHFSVKEYLLSSRISFKPCSKFQVWERASHIFVAKLCLSYFIQVADCKYLNFEALASNPFLPYAANSWSYHVKQADFPSDDVDLNLLCTKLLTPQENWYLNWISLSDPDGYLKRMSFGQQNSPRILWKISHHYEFYDKPTITLPSTLYFASYLGLSHLVSSLIKDGADANAQCGFFFTALHAASYQGHLEVAKLLLSNGADPNTSGGKYGSALQAASFQGHFRTVQLLLQNKADVNIEGGKYGSALQAASYKGYFNIAAELIRAGANVDLKGGRYDSALQAASYEGHYSIAEALVKAGADVNQVGGRLRCALQAAVVHSHINIAYLLLDSGANVNASQGPSGSILRTAAMGGHFELVEVLLERGANVNAEERFGSALQAAAHRGQLRIVQLLLSKGADVNYDGGGLGYPLIAASARGHSEIVRLLLKPETGTILNEQRLSAALKKAALVSSTEIVQLLLDSIPTRSEYRVDLRPAIEIASSQGSTNIVRLLLSKAGTTYTHDDIFGQAVNNASFNGHVEAVRLLLEAGAVQDLDDQGSGTKTANSDSSSSLLTFGESR